MVRTKFNGTSDFKSKYFLKALSKGIQQLERLDFICGQSDCDGGGLRAAVNATGTTITSLLVAKSEGEFDREAFNRSYEEEIVLGIT